MPIDADEIGASRRQPRAVLGIGMTAASAANRRHAGGNRALDAE